MNCNPCYNNNQNYNNNPDYNTNKKYWHFNFITGIKTKQFHLKNSGCIWEEKKWNLSCTQIDYQYLLILSRKNPVWLACRQLNCTTIHSTIVHSTASVMCFWGYRMFLMALLHISHDIIPLKKLITPKFNQLDRVLHVCRTNDKLLTGGYIYWSMVWFFSYNNRVWLRNKRDI